MPTVAITIDPVPYPQDGPASPRYRYPKYPFDDRGDSDVYGAVRRILMEYGCDLGNYGSERWNPLGRWVRPGHRVFILPNFVTHRRTLESADEFNSKCTHTSIIRAIMDYAIIASGSADLVKFGNSSLQGCDYAAVTEQVAAKEIASFYKYNGACDPGPQDLRAVVTEWTPSGRSPTTGDRVWTNWSWLTSADEPRGPRSAPAQRLRAASESGTRTATILSSSISTSEVTAPSDVTTVPPFRNVRIVGPFVACSAFSPFSCHPDEPHRS